VTELERERKRRLQLMKAPTTRRWFDTTWRVTVRDGPLPTIRVEKGAVIHEGTERRIVADGLDKRTALAMAREVKGLRAERVRGTCHIETRPRTPGRSPLVGWIRP
jgi:fructose-bisphosphate aldolase class 1